MNRQKVVVAEEIAEAGLDALRTDYDVDVAIGVDREELATRLKDAAALIVRSATTVDAELISGAPHLSVIGRAGVGVDNIDVAAATAAGVLVVNAPDANTISAAEHTMALLLAQARRVAEADASLRGGAWERDRFRGVELHGKTLGILGLGRIGALVAERAKAFGMRVVAYDSVRSEDRARRLRVELVEFDELLAQSDFISVHVPKTRQTEGMLGAGAFAKMKRGVRLVNVARGAIVDEEALADAVRAGIVGGAAIDVFATEPTTASPLFDLPEVVVTPHLGAATHEAQDKAGIVVAESVATALRGELVPTAVNLDLGPDVPDEIRHYLPLLEDLGQIFVALGGGLGSSVTIAVEGDLAAHPMNAVRLAVLKGLLSTVSDVPPTYVNVPSMAARRDLEIVFETRDDAEDFHTLVRLTGEVSGKAKTVAGTVMGHRGPVLTSVDEYEIELPLSRRMLVLQNADVPGVIGRVGTYLGDARINIANMVVGRAPDGSAAMMGLNLDDPLDDRRIADILALEGIANVHYIELPNHDG